MMHSFSGHLRASLLISLVMCSDLISVGLTVSSITAVFLSFLLKLSLGFCSSLLRLSILWGISILGPASHCSGWMGLKKAHSNHTEFYIWGERRLSAMICSSFCITLDWISKWKCRAAHKDWANSIPSLSWDVSSFAFLTTMPEEHIFSELATCVPS